MKVEILENGIVLASTDIASLTEELTVMSGSVSDDRKASVGRRTADWTVVDRTGVLSPLAPHMAVYPLRDRDVRLWRGIGDELVPLATVQLSSLRMSGDLAGATYSLTGTDRSSTLAVSDWREPLEIEEGTTPDAATQAILSQVDPGHTYITAFGETEKTLDGMTFLPGEDPDPWQAIAKIWESAAMEVFFNQMGVLRSQPIPNPTTVPIAWDYLDDEASIRLAPLGIDVDRSSLRNGVIVRGSAPWLLYGVSAEAWDTDSLSSTYYDPAHPSASNVGPHPEYIDDSLVSDETEAQALADAKLPDVLGIEEQISLNAIPNPALEAGDAVRIKAVEFNTAPRFIFDQLTTPLTYEGVQSANTRRRNR
jgi:hypothetical protein